MTPHVRTSEAGAHRVWDGTILVANESRLLGHTASNLRVLDILNQSANRQEPPKNAISTLLWSSCTRPSGQLSWLIARLEPSGCTKSPHRRVWHASAGNSARPPSVGSWQSLSYVELLTQLESSTCEECIADAESSTFEECIAGIESWQVSERSARSWTAVPWASAKMVAMVYMDCCASSVCWSLR